jgi:hypothetical protein
MNAPIPTPIYRITHISNLESILKSCGLYAPNNLPAVCGAYKSIHNPDISLKRSNRSIPCGPGGKIHDYVAFYLGHRSPMLYQLHTGRVDGYDEGQEPLIYLVANAQNILSQGLQFVFSDGHGIAEYSTWYDDLQQLNSLDWESIYARMWYDDENDPDRQRRKQAEFLVHQYLNWSLVDYLAVINTAMKQRVENILSNYPLMIKPVLIKPAWYY